MQLVKEPNSESIKHLSQQSRFLLRIHQAELAKDRASPATESSRSHLLAAQHTVGQVYGEAVARDVANLAALTGPALERKP
jgi:hypothetical protein